MILVTGATGSVGREVVRQLHTAGSAVRALSRDPNQATFPEGVEPARGDLTRPATLRPALEGVDRLFWMLPGVQGRADVTLPALASQAGVRHIVLLSSLAVEYGSDNAIARAHLEAEEAVRSSGVPWTFLRPGSFMTNTLQWAASIRSQGVVRAPFGDLARPDLDPRDIGAVAAHALLSDQLTGRTCVLTGPECISPREQVRILGDLLGRRLEFEAISEDVARAQMLRSMPAELVDAFFDLNARAARIAPAVVPTVQEVLGRPATRFQRWAADHLAAFR